MSVKVLRPDAIGKKQKGRGRSRRWTGKGSLASFNILPAPIFQGHKDSFKGCAQTTAYESAKAGLNMLTRIWALELAPFGIRANAIAPGPTNTDILKSAGYDEELIHEIHESERSGIPLKRRGEVSDIVANVTLLLNSESTWTTGVVLATDGGISIS